MYDITKYSNPKKVLHNAIKYFGNDVELRLSTHKNKKYMIYDTENNKWVHFGYATMEDYTKHNDDERRRLFRLRNHKWADADEYTPAFLSYYLLW